MKKIYFCTVKGCPCGGRDTVVFVRKDGRNVPHHQR
jgi:hypothetical protein